MDTVEERPIKAERAKKNLSRVALFLGELRDGLTMVCFIAFGIPSSLLIERQFLLILHANQFLHRSICRMHSSSHRKDTLRSRQDLCSSFLECLNSLLKHQLDT